MIQLKSIAANRVFFSVKKKKKGCNFKIVFSLKSSTVCVWQVKSKIQLNKTRKTNKKNYIKRVKRFHQLVALFTVRKTRHCTRRVQNTAHTPTYVLIIIAYSCSITDDLRPECPSPPLTPPQKNPKQNKNKPKQQKFRSVNNHSGPTKEFHTRREVSVFSASICQKEKQQH